MTGEKTQIEDILKNNGVFVDRLGEKTVEIGDVTFQLRAIPSLLARYIAGESTEDDGSTNRGVIEVEYLRYGISGISGGKVKFTTVPRLIMGQKYEAVPDHILDLITPRVLQQLSNDIFLLTHLNEEERKKLDFTTASENGGSNVTTPADAEADLTTVAPDAEQP